MANQSFKPRNLVSREEFDQFRAAAEVAVDELFDRLRVLERTLVAVMDDFYGEDASPDVDDREPVEEAEHEETPEEEAARLRREAAEQFERENEGA